MDEDKAASIKKIKVTQGVYWIEVPEAQVKVLCGCPADSVKHLRKMGLITNTDKGETGPNTILLSDKLLQNGKFANLAEFPVLQMLYNQGMLFDKKTGIKPMLIGSEKQVKAQLEYIKRGNYGLITQKELKNALDKDNNSSDTDEKRSYMDFLWDIKEFFAGGKIEEQDITKIIDTKYIDTDKVEIRKGVFVKRTASNVFKFQYKSEKTKEKEKEEVEVDLNLAPHENYQPAYPLDFHNIKHEHFAVIHSGEGDGFNENRPCMSSILMYQGKIYLIDAGPNVFDSLYALGISVNAIEGIFNTHIHDDHFAGIASLMLADHRIKYYASQPVCVSMRKKLAALMSIKEETELVNYFDFKPLQLDIITNISGLQVTPILSPHSVETNMFIFRTRSDEDSWKTYIHLADLTSFSKLDEIEKELTKISDDDKSNQFVSAIKKNFQTVKKNYKMPANLKKIDIGGGILHGDANDFKDDGSQKIVLSHFHGELNDTQKMIGSGAPFGSTDVLIPANRNYVRDKALKYLRTYLPTFDKLKAMKLNLAIEILENVLKEMKIDDQSGEYKSVMKKQEKWINKREMELETELSALASNPIKTFNPESFIVREGELFKYVYLILTGNVEEIQTETEINNELSAGALIGETYCFYNMPSFSTYRSINFVQALQMPLEHYKQFIKRNNPAQGDILLYHERQFLLQTELFNQSVSYAKLNELAHCIIGSRKVYDEGHFSQVGKSGLSIVRKGKVELNINDRKVITITKGTGEFFGAELMFDDRLELKMRPVKDDTDVIIVRIPFEKLNNIPIVRWKLWQSYLITMAKLDKLQT